MNLMPWRDRQRKKIARRDLVCFLALSSVCLCFRFFWCQPHAAPSIKPVACKSAPRFLMPWLNALNLFVDNHVSLTAITFDGDAMRIMGKAISMEQLLACKLALVAQLNTTNAVLKDVVPQEGVLHFSITLLPI